MSPGTISHHWVITHSWTRTGVSKLWPASQLQPISPEWRMVFRFGWGKKKKRLLVRGMCSLYGIQIFVLVNEVLLDHSHAHPRWQRRRLRWRPHGLQSLRYSPSAPFQETCCWSDPRARRKKREAFTLRILYQNLFAAWPLMVHSRLRRSRFSGNIACVTSRLALLMDFGLSYLP